MRSWSGFALLVVLTAASAEASTFTRVRLTQDPNPDWEPTVTRQTAGAVTATIVGYIKSVNTFPRNHFISRGDDGVTVSGVLALPPGTTWNYSADPYLAPNQAPAALHPQRTYMVGALGFGSNLPSAIATWYSDDAGRTWSAPTVIARSGTGTGLLLTDKPHIAVSQASNAAGHVYVAYKTEGAGNVNAIRISRSTNGDTWPGVAGGEDVEIYSSSNSLNCAQVVVAANGYIYVLWVDYIANRIMLARSPSPGVIHGAWTIDFGGPTGNFFRKADLMDGNLSAITVPVARHNWVTNKIIVVWHEKESPTSNRADVYIAAKGTTGWQPKQKISVETCNVSGPVLNLDQFRPAFDYKSSGELYITYYSRQRDCPTNQVYDHYFVRLGNGNPFPVLEGPKATTNFLSNPALNGNTVGEYQEVWCSATTCYNAWIGTDVNWGDVYLTTIQ